MHSKNNLSCAMVSHNLSLVWLRRDLRLADNTALARAAAAGRIAIVFVFDTTILGALADRDDRRVSFIHRSLAELDETLRRQGSALLVRIGDPVEEIPRLVRETGADAVYVNRDYEPSAIARDEAVARSLAAHACTFHDFKDQVVFDHTEVRTQEGGPFRVFTPYKRAWLARFAAAGAVGEDPLREENAPMHQLIPLEQLLPHLRSWTFADIGFRENSLPREAGEGAAQTRLRDFLTRIEHYKSLRDFPARDGTSRLSVHLRFGTVSIRACLRASIALPGEGPATWVSELIWREFYQMILASFPHVARGAFKTEYDSLVWPGRDGHFDAWTRGCTGYPLVDAAMRHFNATGWMHNRLRMVVAMFLTKDLLVDWRRGEAYFARHLLDYDLASNNGGWQWSASTGVDAQPYFRVFNPLLQSRRFDPDGTFIRAHCPELRGFGSTRIHWPHDADPAEQREAGCIIGRDYPKPIVDHRTQKDKAVAMFKRPSSS